MYVADFSEWLAEHEQSQSSHLNFMTIQEHQHLYNAREVQKALEAKEFLRNAGYPSMKEALNLVRDGDLVGIPYSPDDIRRYYDISKPQVENVRGTMTKQHTRAFHDFDPAAREQRTQQSLVSDVMFVDRERFLISVSSPLELTIASHLKSLSRNKLGEAMQAQFQLLRSRGFEPVRMLVDPQKALAALRNAFPGIEFDESGAGDHLGKVDAKIRRLKEMIQSVLAGLPYSLPKARIKDLVNFVVN
jgi:hypothetical protein